MTGDSPLAGALSRITGTGGGAGYAAFFVVLGIASVVVAVGAWAYPPLRNLERDVPDAEGLPSEDGGAETPVRLDVPPAPGG
jgi:hypothetical protein